LLVPDCWGAEEDGGMGAEVTGSQDYLSRYAELVVRVGANVQPDQEVVIGGLVEHAPVVRAIARHAYVAGARRVSVDYQDLPVQHAAAEFGPVEWLGRTPEHVLAGIRNWAQDQPALIRLTGNPAPQLFSDLDPARVAALAPKDKAAAAFPLLSGDVVAWTVVAAPNSGWARAIFGAPELERLWAAVAQATCLDREDPVVAWREHVAELGARAAALAARRFDAIRFRGPGTDLTVGLIPGARWLGAATSAAPGWSSCPTCPPRRSTPAPTGGAPTAPSG